MSNWLQPDKATGRFPRDYAHDRALEIVDELRELTDDIGIYGSIRRGKSFVKDAEIVAIPRNVSAFWARVDRLVHSGMVTKARYGTDGLHRWGQKYRGLMYANIKIEIFLANRINRGYTEWLRTGSSDANEWLLKNRLRAINFKLEDGYAWQNGRRLIVPDETTFFALFGLPYIPPQRREVPYYQHMCRIHTNRQTPRLRYADEPTAPPVQTSLF